VTNRREILSLGHFANFAKLSDRFSIRVCTDHAINEKFDERQAI
jgi:hypothetical protein